MATKKKAKGKTTKAKSTTKAKPQQVRQGDIFLDPVASIPTGGKQTAKGSVVLVRGASTGNTHAVTHKDATLHELPNGRRYLKLPKAAVLTHQEHDHIKLAAGVYEVVRQRESFGFEARTVED